MIENILPVAQVTLTFEMPPVLTETDVDEDTGHSFTNRHTVTPGETSDMLSEALFKLARFYDRKADNKQAPDAADGYEGGGCGENLTVHTSVLGAETRQKALRERVWRAVNSTRAPMTGKQVTTVTNAVMTILEENHG